MVDAREGSQDESTEIAHRTPADARPTRRSLRPLSHARTPVRAASVAAVSPTFRSRAPRKARRGIRSAAVMALAIPGLVAAVGLPAYATLTPSGDAAQLDSSVVQTLKESGAQSLTVKGDVDQVTATRDGYSATTATQLAEARAEEEAAAAREAAAEEAARNAAENESAEEVAISTAAAVEAGEDLEINGDTSYQSQLFEAAKNYVGVPYVFGGGDPSGWDCSGYVKYIYAQFGMNLPHSSTAQGNMGTVIPMSEAVPGDLLVKPGHIGFYAGEGQILHASQPGVPTRIGPQFGSYTAIRLPVG